MGGRERERERERMKGEMGEATCFWCPLHSSSSAPMTSPGLFKTAAAPCWRLLVVALLFVFNRAVITRHYSVPTSVFAVDLTERGSCAVLCSVCTGSRPRKDLPFFSTIPYKPYHAAFFFSFYSPLDTLSF